MPPVNNPQYIFNTPDLTQAYPYLRIYHGQHPDVLSEATPKGGDLWYDTTFSSYSVLRYYNSETSKWVLVQDYNTGASKNIGQEMFGDNTLCGNVTFSYATYTSSSSGSSSGGGSSHCGASSSEEASSSNDYTEDVLAEAECTNPYAIFDGELQSLGIGNLYPESTLHVSNDGSDAVIKIGQHYDGVSGPSLDLVHTRGTFLIPQDVQASDDIGSVRALVYDSSITNEVVLGSLSWSVGPTVSGSSTLSVKTHDGTSLTEIIAIDETGVVSFSGNIQISSGSHIDLGTYVLPYSATAHSDGMMFVLDEDSGEMKEWMTGAKTTIGFFIDGDGTAISVGAKLDALRQIDQYWGVERVRVHTPDGVTSLGSTTTVQIMKSSDIDDTDANIDAAASALTISGGVSADSVSFTQPKSGTVYETRSSIVTGAGNTIAPDNFIYPKVTVNGQNIIKLHIFVELKALVV